MPSLVITRLTETRYSVQVLTVLDNGAYLSDDDMYLDGDTLREKSHEGLIRTHQPIIVKLGCKSLPAVQGLDIGESVTL